MNPLICSVMDPILTLPAILLAWIKCVPDMGIQPPPPRRQKRHSKDTLQMLFYMLAILLLSRKFIWHESNWLDPSDLLETFQDIYDRYSGNSQLHHFTFHQTHVKDHSDPLSSLLKTVKSNLFSCGESFPETVKSQLLSSNDESFRVFPKTVKSSLLSCGESFPETVKSQLLSSNDESFRAFPKTVKSNLLSCGESLPETVKSQLLSSNDESFRVFPKTVKSSKLKSSVKVIDIPGTGFQKHFGDSSVVQVPP